tara:strand:+ start:161 stop:475 length:315 start_codon:yes stop_codon:yes gene_type:complete
VSKKKKTIQSVSDTAKKIAEKIKKNAEFEKRKEKFTQDLLESDDFSPSFSKGIKTGRIVFKSKDPKIQAAIDKKMGKAGSVKPIKKMKGGGIAIKGFGKALTGK